MSKTKIAFLFIIVLIIAFVVFVFVYKSPQTTPTESIIPTVTPTAVLQTWTDPAGFIFQYPAAVTIDSHPEDDKNYSNLTLTYPDSSIIQITMSDNIYKNIDAWVGKNNAIDTTLGGKSAKKILSDGVTEIGCIDSEVLVTIKGSNISGITDTWEFFYPTPTTGKAVIPVDTGSGGGENVLEEE